LQGVAILPLSVAAPVSVQRVLWDVTREGNAASCDGVESGSSPGKIEL